MQTAQQQKLQLNGRPLPEPAATIWRIIRKECQGRENARVFLKENPKMLEKLESEIRKAIKEGVKKS